MRRWAIALVMCVFVGVSVIAQSSAPSNPLWHDQKIKNYLPHMTWPEVRDLLTRTDMVIMPVTSIEEHGHQGPLGTDFFNGLERAKLVAQKSDVLVAPILFPGNSPYHMTFPGRSHCQRRLSSSCSFRLLRVLIAHGFKRVLLLNSHGGNQAISRYVVDRINQETPGIAVELGEASAPFLKGPRRNEPAEFDRHAGVNETSASLYLTPNLVNMREARTAPLTLLPHLQKMLPEVVAGDPTATLVFLAESLKAERLPARVHVDQGDDHNGCMECSRCSGRHCRAWSRGRRGMGDRSRGVH